jgi:hypothetical protein
VRGPAPLEDLLAADGKALRHARGAPIVTLTPPRQPVLPRQPTGRAQVQRNPRRAAFAASPNSAKARRPTHRAACFGFLGDTRETRRQTARELSTGLSRKVLSINHRTLAGTNLEYPASLLGLLLAALRAKLRSARERFFCRRRY